MKDEPVILQLKPLIESPKTYDELEARLRKFFFRILYLPLIQELGITRKAIQNAAHPNALVDALYRGQILYRDGVFSGQFTAEISKALKALGATFHPKRGTYRLAASELPTEVKAVVASSQNHFQEKMKKIDEKLAALVPEDLAEKFTCEDLFDQALWKADREFQKNVKNITVSPELSPERRALIAKDWQGNMKLWIQGWTKDQIQELRKTIFEEVMSGQRRETLIPPLLKITKTIQKSHEKAVNKAKFLAHQETRLLMTTFKQAQYEEAGSTSYIWRCRHRPHDSSPKHHIPGNVRYSHGLLNGRTFKWADPPVTSNPGQPTRRNHPGRDYYCFCHAAPLITKKKAE